MPTRSALRTEIRRICGDTNSIRFSTAQLDTWLDMANSDVISRLGPFDTSFQSGTLVGSNTFASSEPNYQLNINTIHIKELKVENESDQLRRLEIISMSELAERYGTAWEDNVSANLGEPFIAYKVDYNVFGLYPRPNLNQNGNAWQAYYYRVPSAFASDTDTPIFLDALHDSLTWFCASRGFAQLGDADKSDWALARYKTIIREFYSTATKFADEMKGFRWGVS